MSIAELDATQAARFIERMDALFDALSPRFDYDGGLFGGSFSSPQAWWIQTVPTGWICPVCHCGVAPSVKVCPCKGEGPKVTKGEGHGTR